MTKARVISMGELYGHVIWIPKNLVPEVLPGDTLITQAGSHRRVLRVQGRIWWHRITYQFKAAANRDNI